nr:hypothetical protein [Gemmata massiliana]
MLGNCPGLSVIIVEREGERLLVVLALEPSMRMTPLKYGDVTSQTVSTNPTRAKTA